MLNTYIKNRGITQTIIHDNNHNHFNQINWDADYDGNIANIIVNSNNDGKRDRFNISLDNEDLANILNIPSINTPIDERLKMDFQESTYRVEPYFLQLPSPELLTPELEPRKPKTIEQIIDRPISSPSVNEELIVPLTIDKKTIDDYTLTPKKRHRRHKTHVTHKVYKKPKTSTKSKSKSKTRSMKKSVSMPIVNLINSF
jgi:hypothetical protein